jgi:tagatose 1,6-diphosphate aldolase GatY/KbaY
VRARLTTVLAAAGAAGRATPACNVYTLDQAAGVLEAASERDRAVILQVHPGGLGDGVGPLVAGLRELADRATVACPVVLDHCGELDVIRVALALGVDAVMADGSHLPAAENAAFVREAARLAHADGAEMEAELGRLSGEEDGLRVEEREARLTDPAAVPWFLAASRADALAVSVGTVHGATAAEPRLDLVRLAAIRASTAVPLALHGASGLGAATLRAAIERGVTKVNVNTELRTAYVRALRAADGPPELVAVLARGRRAVAEVTRELFDRLELRPTG